MNGKYRFSFGAPGIISFIFMPMGALFIAVGIIVYHFTKNDPMMIKGTHDPMLFMLIFVGVGALFLLIGSVMLVFVIRKNLAKKRVFEEGYYIWAEYVNAFQDMNVNINGMHPFVAEFASIDQTTGMTDVFRSPHIRFDPTPVLRGKQVKVYTRPDDHSVYYIDLDSELSNVRVY